MRTTMTLIAGALAALAIAVPAEAGREYVLEAELPCSATGCGGYIPVHDRGRAILTTGARPAERAGLEIVVSRDLAGGKRRELLRVAGGARVRAVARSHRITVNAARPRPRVRIKSRTRRYQAFVVSVRWAP